MKSMLIISVLLLSMSHPMTMLISVILLTILVSMMFYQNSCNSLFPLILILLILGGMLMIFMYMISLCPNKKMNFKLKSILLLLMLMLSDFNLIFTKFYSQELMKIYYFSYLNVIMFMMIYLLISLMVVMKILNWISCPMKSQ
uniref:NADH dehydrogenase subunit 6 n=1 Tax=Amblyomma dubitatum TaxID=321419 RepID=UPI002E797C00|nr:NADH dehydrogenase subunit 6 [Amblyomma dubitatum]WQF69015.1 NADH dehydrogenase subunit 6 [Amblyomma dubitatum]